MAFLMLVHALAVKYMWPGFGYCKADHLITLLMFHFIVLANNSTWPSLVHYSCTMPLLALAKWSAFVEWILPTLCESWLKQWSHRGHQIKDGTEIDLSAAKWDISRPLASWVLFLECVTTLNSAGFITVCKLGYQTLAFNIEFTIV